MPPRPLCGRSFLHARRVCGCGEDAEESDYQKTIAKDPDFPEYRGFFDTAKKNLKTLVDAGVPYAFGTDTVRLDVFRATSNSGRWI